MSDTFCPLLFQHLATHPHGGVTHCCIADHRNALSSSRDDDKFYNLNRDTVHDTMNSKSFRKARLEVLDGKKPQACLRCYSEEAKGMASMYVMLHVVPVILQVQVSGEMITMRYKRKLHSH